MSSIEVTKTGNITCLKQDDATTYRFETDSNDPNMTVMMLSMKTNEVSEDFWKASNITITISMDIDS